MGADTQEDMEGWMKAISGASYEYLKICVSQLKSQLRDLDESSQNALVYGAVKDRNTLRNAGHLKNSPQDSNSSLNHDASAIKRHNPFNTGESFDRESVCNSISEPERRIQTFLEMHEELRAQIEEIMKLWQAQKFQSGPMLGDKNAT
ncbi:hypothetical protein DPMN_013744 [Dreissena polymorpha]|uniref:PH domain-containing protein n=2 Tax=Dreissena polymorpha TaxID=45954 RepID=A0A9D4S4L0_DREPO|nr:hypothetical protein DPMN_013744 [Dreissena polymorpha]